jgi:hypothetical protein
MDAQRIPWLLVGGAMLVAAVLAWSGLWRSWIRSPSYGYAVLVIFPGTGLALVAFALTGLLRSYALSLVLVVGACAAVAGWALYVWRPRWLGPRYWREHDPDPLADRQTADLVAAGGPPPERHSQRLARAQREPARPLATRHVALVDPAFGKPSGTHRDGIAIGVLLLYPDEIVFAAGPGDDALRPGPTIRVLDPTTVTEVLATEDRGQRNTVRLVTTDTTHPWEIRAERRRALLDDLYVHYGHRRSRSV